jgi:hypothetical protein
VPSSPISSNFCPSQGEAVRFGRNAPVVLGVFSGCAQGLEGRTGSWEQSLFWDSISIGRAAWVACRRNPYGRKWAVFLFIPGPSISYFYNILRKKIAENEQDISVCFHFQFHISSGPNEPALFCWPLVPAGQRRIFYHFWCPLLKKQMARIKCPVGQYTFCSVQSRCLQMASIKCPVALRASNTWLLLKECSRSRAPVLLLVPKECSNDPKVFFHFIIL